MHDHLIHDPAPVNAPPASAPVRVLRALSVLGALVAGVVRLAGIRRVVVEGASMLPTLVPGDRLVVVRARRPAVGDLVAVPDPRRPRRLLVKRIASEDGDSVELRGDNPASSTDSRRFGPISKSSLRWRVVHRYAPPSAGAGSAERREYHSAMAWLSDELDRLFAPDYLDGLDERSLDELRAMRAECDHAETAVSYLRRVAQGRLDVVQVILNQEDADLSAVVAQLPSIIGSGPPRPAGPGRLPTRLAPDMETVEADDLTEDIDAVIDPGALGSLPTMDRSELRSLSERLIEVEARISAQRKALHERIDAVQAEIVNRYKSGDASADGLLT